MKFRLVLFFTFLFSIIIIAPTVITLVDDTCDVALFLELNEEEEKKGNESAKELEIKIYSSNQYGSLIINELQKKKNVSYNSKEYTSKFPKIDTPPPEFLS